MQEKDFSLNNLWGGYSHWEMRVGVDTYGGKVDSRLPSHTHSLSTLYIDVSFFSFFFMTQSVSYYWLANHFQTQWLICAIIYSHSCICRLAGVRLDPAEQCCFKVWVLLGLTPCGRLGSGLPHTCLMSMLGPRLKGLSRQWQRPEQVQVHVDRSNLLRHYVC